MSEAVRCAGCGSPWTDADLAAEHAKNPAVLSCCPERNPLTIDQWRERVSVAIRETASECATIASDEISPETARRIRKRFLP